MDRLSPLFSRFDVSTRVFYSGVFCGESEFDGTAGVGHLHILRQGVLRVNSPSTQTLVIDRPSVLFYPQPYRHRLQSTNLDNAELVCATIELGLSHPLFNALPELLVIPLKDVAGLETGLTLLFAEAFDKRSARQAALDCLAKYFLILLLRHVLDAQFVDQGMVAGLADERLGKAITAMHGQAEHPWSLDTLAQIAGMSRARFAARFREVVGTTPMNYLTDWRISVAQSLLARGNSLKFVAPEVGYATPTALTRVFCKRIGMSPTEWLARKVGDSPPPLL
ncbi:MAG: AraC family transcriptional regulator [Betaproteobacteria bacterium]|nr:AraC family transcriptional regulator [Betaproteobacteria bacterium]